MATLLLTAITVGACGSAADSTDDSTDEAAESSSTTEPPASPTTKSAEENRASTSSDDNEPAQGDDPEELVAGEPFSCTPAPADTTSITTLTDWASVDARRIEYEKIRTDTRREMDGLSNLTPVDLMVTGPLDGGWQLVWQNDATILDDLEADFPADVVETIEALAAELPKQRIEYQVEADGGYLNVTNHDEVRQDMITTFEALIESDLVIPGIEQTTAVIASMSDDELAQLLSEPVEAYHSLAGIELELDAPVEFADQLPNAFGGDPIPATTSIELTNLVDDDGCVEIVALTTFDPEAILPLISESFAQAYGLNDPNEQEHAELEALVRSFQAENELVGQFDITTGLFYRVTATERIGLDGEEKIDTIIVTDVTTIPAG